MVRRTICSKLNFQILADELGKNYNFWNTRTGSEFSLICVNKCFTKYAYSLEIAGALAQAFCVTNAKPEFINRSVKQVYPELWQRRLRKTRLEEKRIPFYGIISSRIKEL